MYLNKKISLICSGFLWLSKISLFEENKYKLKNVCMMHLTIFVEIVKILVVF